MTVQLGTPIALGTLQLNAVDDDGVTWLHSDLKGWSSAPARVEFQPRQADHGAWPSPVYLDGRPVTITGKIAAPTTAARDAAIERLIAAVSLTDTTLTVSETIPKQLTLRRSGDLLIEMINPYSVTYSALMTAADPRRYSTTLQTQSTGLPSTTGGLTVPVTLPINLTSSVTGGAFTLINDGSIGTRPVFTIQGPAINPIIACTHPDGSTDQLSYAATLVLGDSLVIDTDAHSVILNGTASRRRYLSGSWPEIGPVSSLAVQWSAPVYDAAALLTGTCRSAWM
ncbi:hypothetical protein ABTX82_01860 [Streptomyces lavendulae]|uniref:hypothetical protein n=1 Tax=Streptomyces lavendulae TaxID=1914 RepID=UPI003329AB16